MTLNLNIEQAIARDFAELLARKREDLQHAVNLASRLGTTVPVMVTVTLHPKENACIINMSFEKPATEFVADNIKSQFIDDPK